MDDIRLANGQKRIVFPREEANAGRQGQTPLRVGFVYDTPLKNFPPF